MPKYGQSTETNDIFKPIFLLLINNTLRSTKGTCFL